jgi:hypothetical protein
MDYLDHLLTSNLFGTFIGWLAYNAFLWKREKDKYDKQHKRFPWSCYMRENVDDWAVGVIFMFVLLWIGARGLGLNPFVGSLDIASPDWNDLYYLSAGILPELLGRVLLRLGVAKAE